jgi:hypothetical protein
MMALSRWMISECLVLAVLKYVTRTPLARLKHFKGIKDNDT